MQTKANKYRTPVSKDSQIIIPRNDLSIDCSYQFEIPLTNTGQGGKNQFPRNDILNPKGTGSVLFTGWEVYTRDFLVRAESGNNVVTPADATKLTVTLVFKEDEFVYQFPYIGLISALNYGMIRRLDRKQIDITKSYITVMDAGLAASQSAVINWFFIPSNQ